MTNLASLDSLKFLEEANAFSSLDYISYQYFNFLLNKRSIIFNEEVSETLVESVIMPLLGFEADDSNEKVTLYINSPGGSATDGLVLCNVIDLYRKPLDIIVLGYAYSMGTILLASGSKNPNVTRKGYPFTTGLIHSGSVMYYGETHSAKDTMDFQTKLDDVIRDYIVNNTKISLEEYSASERKQWYLNAIEMKEKGLLDVIIGLDDR